MSYGVYGWVVWGAFVMLSAVLMFVYGWRSGQFRHIEEPKYRMLEDREPQGWPGREPTESVGSYGRDKERRPQ